MDFLTNLSPWHWWALCVLLLAVELVAPSSLFLWPAVAAGIVGVVLWFQPQIGLVAQILVFGILATAAIVTMRTRFWRKPRPAPDEPVLNVPAARLAGRKGVVVEEFRNGRGQILLDDSRWQAETADGRDLAIGANVQVQGMDGLLLKVAPVP